MNDPHQLLSGYAVDALDADDRAAFEAHLSGCADCRRELAELTPAITDLAALTDTEPPPQLRGDILAAIGQVRQDAPTPNNSDLTNTDPANTEPIPLDRARSRRTRIARTAAAVVAAAALVAAIALGGWAVGRQQLRQQTRADGVAISRVLSAPDAHTYRKTAPNGMRMTYIVSEERNAALAIPDEVVRPGDDRTYQLWTVTVRGGDTDYVPDRTFDHDGGPILLTGNIGAAAAIGVTVEPAGGASSPTGQPFAVQSL